MSRDADKGAAAVADIAERVGGATVELAVGDLGSLATTRALAEVLLERYERIDVFINNAGLWPTARQETPTATS